MDAFDADVLIYAAAPDHALGRRVARLFRDADGPADSEPRAAGVGSVLLVPELLAKPMRGGRDDEVDALSFFLARLDLLPIDCTTADLAGYATSRPATRQGLTSWCAAATATPR